MMQQQYEDALRNQGDLKNTKYEASDTWEARQEQEDTDAMEQQRIQRRKERMAVMRRKKRQQEMIRRWTPVVMSAMAALALMVWGIVKLAGGPGSGGGEPPVVENLESAGETGGQSDDAFPQGMAADDQSGEKDGQQLQEETPADAGVQEEQPESFLPQSTERTAGFPETERGIYSTHGILIDVEKEEIIAQKDPYAQISPASMTKILTLLVAAEHVTDLQDTFTITRKITDYSFQNDCSNVGFDVGEVVTVEDLLYGTILPSGADAAVGLAEYVAGSQEAFVELMNQKLEQLGLSDSAHFTNCVGLYDADHYCTVYGMAMILKAASDNELCRKVLSARTYTTSSTAQHTDGILISNWFLRRIEDKDTHGEVLCAKTGFVNQSGSCAASLATDHDGREYLCVTAGSVSSWACIYDQVELYQAFLPEGMEEASAQ